MSRRRKHPRMKPKATGYTSLSIGGVPIPVEHVEITTYEHGEAFMMMRYESDDAATWMHIWNSRDGVTPFVCSHPVTGVEMQHVRWGNDHRVPDYEPFEGEWVFADLHPEHAMQMAVEFVERWWDDEGMPMRDHPHYNPDGDDGPQAKMRAAAIHAQAMCEPPGQPSLIKVTGPWLDGLRASRS